MTGAEWAAAGPVVAALIGFVTGVVVFGILARVMQR